MEELTPQQLQQIFDDLCEAFDQSRKTDKILRSPSIFLRDYFVPQGMTFGQVFYQYMSFMHEYEHYNYYQTYPLKEGETEVKIWDLLNERYKTDVPAEVFEFEEEREEEDDGWEEYDEIDEI
ncbi:MAG: hypothetical protein K6A64_07160 [Bacteroidales bacterium]|nr:hypothetical protein [Bacteroidales bacterium]